MNNKRLTFIGLIFCFILLVIPSFNMIAPLPDFIAYFFFAFLIGKSTEIVPYLAEAKSAALKLGYVTLARLPAAAVMLMNMHAGRDIVPLFTLVFAVIEAILLYSLITNLFSGLYYMSERCELPEIISPVEFFGKKASSDTVRALTLFFALAKCTLNVLPEFCLLTTENPSLKKFFIESYPVLLIVCMLASLLFGIVWFVFAYKYARNIYKCSDLTLAIEGLAGEEKLAIINNKIRISSFTKTLTLLAVSTVFSFDIVFDNTGGVNLLPHFIFGALLFYVGMRIYEGRGLKIALAVSQLLFTVFGLLSHYFTIRFLDSHTMLELLDREDAKAAYRSVEIFSLLETLSFIALTVLMAIGFRKFLTRHTGIDPSSDGYNRTELQYHRRSALRACVFFGIAALVQILKCLKVFLDAKIELIFSETDVIVTSPLPWLGWATVGVCVLLIGYAFYYLSEVKADVRFKYDKEEKEAKRGLYE